MKDKIGPFIVPEHALWQQQRLRGCVFSFHTVHEPRVNQWIKRKKSLLLVPDFLNARQARDFCNDLNRLIKEKLSAHKIPYQEFSQRYFFMDDSTYATLAEFAHKSGRKTVSPTDYFNQASPSGYYYFISMEDVEFIHNHGLEIDLSPVILKYEQIVQDQYADLKETVLSLNEICGNFGWSCILLPQTKDNGHQIHNFDEIHLSLSLPFAAEDKKREISKKLIEPLTALENKIGGLLKVEYQNYTNALSLKIIGSLPEIKKTVKTLDHHKQEVQQVLSDIIGKSNPLALMQAFWSGRQQFGILLKSSNQDSFCLSELFYKNPALFDQCFAEIEEAAASYLETHNPGMLASAYDGYMFADLDQIATIQDWLGQQNAVYSSEIKLTERAKQMICLCMPVCKGLIGEEFKPHINLTAVPALENVL